MIRTQQYNLGQIISEGWRLYKQNFYIILSIILIIYIPTNISLILGGDKHCDEIMNRILYSAIVNIVNMAIAVIIERTSNNETITLGEALAMGSSKLAILIDVLVRGGLIIIGTTLPLIIPGIIYLGYYSFIVYVVALRDLRGQQALDYSKKLVEGQWWRVVGVFLIIFTLNILLILMLSSLISFLPDKITENFIFLIIQDILINVIGTLFITISVVFFLNTDYQKYRDKNMLSDSV